MMVNKRVVLLVLAGLTLTSLMCCKTAKKLTTWTPPTGEYAFVEYYQVKEGKVLEGEVSPGRRIDGPTYSFLPETGEVQSFLNNNFDKDSLKLLLGRGLVLRGTQGGGMHSRLISVNNLPIKEDKLTIHGFGKDGMLSITWDDKDLNMIPGDVWVHSIMNVDTIDSPNGRAVVENTTTYSIKFFGYLKKDKFTY